MDNPQYLVFNENRDLLHLPRTIICTGLGRSGTSAVASLVEFLGVWVGVPAHSRNRENKELIRALGDGPEAASRLIAEYDERFPVWGFKAPSLRKRLHETLELFRNPLVIVPHRDVVGRLGRQTVSGQQQATFERLQSGIQNQRRLIEELERVSAPQLHISFPLLTESPEQSLRIISDFTGVPIPQGDVRVHMNRFREQYLAAPAQAAS
jgi:hypothetical protein